MVSNVIWFRDCAAYYGVTASQKQVRAISAQITARKLVLPRNFCDGLPEGINLRHVAPLYAREVRSGHLPTLPDPLRSAVRQDGVRFSFRVGRLHACNVPVYAGALDAGSNYWTAIRRIGPRR